MKCSRCSTSNRPTATFCRDCGARLQTRACPGCGAPADGESRFCDACGLALRGGPLAFPPARLAAPSRYTPEHLAAQIIRSRAALEGERKQVTVLIADVKGSMELLAERDPEEARQLLDPVLDLMMDAVHLYEGIVNQVMGDGIMALFGAPIAREDHGLRACYAALRMQQAAARYGDETQRTHGIPVQIRVGVNSGEVVVRSIGSDLDMDYTAVGQSTHVAGRLEQIAKPGTILCSAATFRLGAGFLRGRSLGALSIRGLASPVEAFELLGAEGVGVRFHVAAERGLTRFVGREREYARVVEALQPAATGQGRAVALVGEPGVGKSRLLWEYSHSPHTAGWLVLEGGGVSYGASIPYLPVVALARGYFRIGERDDMASAREKVAARLLALDPSLGSTLPAFLALLDVPVDDAEWNALDPTQRRQRTNDAIRRLLLRESQIQPVLVILEDLHWIDRETQALLDQLTAGLVPTRIALLTDYRPEYRHEWAGPEHFTEIELDPLPAPAADALLEGLLGTDPALQPLKRRLVERTAGNPFFLEESVRALVDTGVLEGEPGARRVSGAVDTLQVPASVQAVLAARIDRLEAGDKRLLQDASAIGNLVPVKLLRAVADSPTTDVRARLVRLRDAGFLQEARLYPEVEYAFAHALTHEVAYAGLLHERRKALHAAILDAMEQLYAGRLAEHVERLAHHASQGEAWPRAVQYYRQAGDKSAARSAYREAVVFYEQALAALEHVPVSAERHAAAIDLRFALRNALFPLGEIGRDVDNLRRAEVSAQAVADRGRLAWIYTYMTRDLSILGRSDEAQAFGRQALALAATLDDFELRVLTNAYLGSVSFAAGDYRNAVALLREALGALPGSLAYQRFGLPGPASIFFRYWLVGSLVRLGEFAEAVERAEQGIAIAAAIDQPLALAVAHYVLGFAQVFRGRPVAAVTDLERSLQLCRQWDLRAWFTNIASITGYAYALSGRVAEGIELMQQGIDRSTALNAMVNHSSEVVRLGEAHVMAARWDEAEAAGVRALDLARVHKERGNEAYALRLLADIAAHREPPAVEKARALFGQTRALAEELGMRPLVALCRAGLAELHRRAGDAAAAEAELAGAEELAAALGMTPTWRVADPR
jgi:class 3 adenylate cyclase/tetratricopeptide (TPR) repeat protein